MVAARFGTISPRESISRTLRREILSLLVVKLFALAVMFFVFFGPSERPDVNAENIKDALLSQTKDAP